MNDQQQIVLFSETVMVSALCTHLGINSKVAVHAIGVKVVPREKFVGDTESLALVIASF